MKIRNLLLCGALALLPLEALADVICSAGRENRNPIHFVIDATRVLMIMSTTATKNYNDCWPVIPATPPKKLYSCSETSEGFTDFLEFDANRLDQMMFYHTVPGSDERRETVTIPMRCTKRVGAQLADELFE